MVPLLRLLALLRLLLTQPAAVQASSVPELISVAELQSKTTVWGPGLSLSAEGAQMGGSIVNYEHGLSFQTVHGAGHMVPQFRPQASLHQIAKVLLAQPFAPLLPSNATLANMTDAEYDTALDTWTVAAKKAPFTDPFLI